MPRIYQDSEPWRTVIREVTLDTVDPEGPIYLMASPLGLRISISTDLYINDEDLS